LPAILLLYAKANSSIILCSPSATFIISLGTMYVDVIFNAYPEKKLHGSFGGA
jgi:hypothetical protein